uniref:Uncharacterized protein n=1 Tax=Paramormyrops kingsleyae TaxID=1676925 RepID=A0A3B3R1T4_9TELE
MGGGSSTPVTVEKKTELLGKPWRNVVTQTDLKQYLLDYKPTIDSVPQARILLIGRLQAGKSSFFNSINSIFRGNITSQAGAGEMTTSLTLKVKAGRGGQPLAFLLCDTMGLEQTDHGGVNPKDIMSILKGCIPDEYRVRAVYLTSKTDSVLIAMSLLMKLCHLVMGYSIQYFIINVIRDTFLLMFLDVPLVVLLTKVDRACPLVEEDLENVYRSCYIRELIKKASGCLGIAESNVLPVKNYSSEIELNDTCDILLLSAMKQMLNFADNYLDNFD